MDNYLQFKNGKECGMPDILRKQRITVKSSFERRIIYAMLQKAYEGIDIEKPFKINVKQVLIGSIKNKKSGSEYKILREACNNVLKITIELRPDDPKNFEMTQIVSYAKYVDKQLVVAFSRFIVDEIKAMVEQGNYTRLMHYCTMIMRSEHSVNLYIMLKNKASDSSQFSYSVSEIRNRLGINDKMKTWIEFRRYIIERSQTYFKKHSDIIYDFKPSRTGRRITDIEFTIYKNKSFFKNIPKEIQKKELPKETHLLLLKKYLPIEDLYNKAVKFQGNNPRYIRYIVNQFNDDKANGRIKSNLVGYFFKIFMNNHDKYLAEHEIEKRRKDNQRLRLKRYE